MKKILDRIRKRRLINIAQNISIFLITILLTSAAFAIRVEINATVPAGFTGPIQLIRAVNGVDSPGPGANEMGGAGADDVLTRMVPIVDGALGGDNLPLAIQDGRIVASGGVEQAPAGKVDIVQGTVLNLRVWDGAAGLGHKYIQRSQAITWAARDASVPWVIKEDDWTRRTAAIPTGIGVKVDKEAIERTADGQPLRLTISAFSSGIEDVVSTKMQISKDRGFADAGALTIAAATRVCEGAYFAPAQTYFIRAQMTNNYGTSTLPVDVGVLANPGISVVGKIGEYSTLAGGGGGQNIEVDRYILTLNLSKRDGGFGINTFVLPELPLTMHWEWTSGANTGKLLSIGDLINMVNLSATKNVIKTIGFWDRDQQKIMGGIISYDSGSAALSRIKGELTETEPIRPLVGYQLYVSETVPLITLKGVKN